jgi:hypothetical protein
MLQKQISRYTAKRLWRALKCTPSGICSRNGAQRQCTEMAMLLVLWLLAIPVHQDVTGCTDRRRSLREECKQRTEFPLSVVHANALSLAVPLVVFYEGR